MNTSLTNSTIYYKFEYHYLSPSIIIPIHAVDLFLGLPLNIYIIILLFRGHGVMDAVDVLSFNQTIAEMLFMLCAPFHIMCSINLKFCLFGAVGLLLTITLASRCLFPCGVCLERYLAVVHPMIFLKYKSTRYRVALSIMIWLFILAIGITGALTFPYMPYNIFSVMYIFVLSVDVFCGASILRRLRHPGPQDNDTGEMNAIKKKAFQIISINLLIFLIQNIPFCVMFGIQDTVSQYTFGMVAMISIAISTVSGFWQSLFMLHKTGKLPLMWSVCFLTPFSNCFIQAGTKFT